MKLKNTILPIALFAFHTLNAQTNFSGTWNGILNIAGTLHIVLHVTQLQNGIYSGTLESPDQSKLIINCDKVTVTGNTISFNVDKIKVSYTGSLINDSTVSGTFTQGVNLPLDFHRTDSSYAAKPVIRLQTPKPPFPYKSEEVIYSGNGLQFGGTITIPQGSGSFPAVLLITGSGQQDRDETIFDHKPFAVLADALTRDGFVVLRVDDRGKGNSTGNFENSTTADFTKDVNASVEYLKTRKEVNDKKIGLLGHSEGGMIAPIVASQRKDINFIVLLAAPGVKIIDLITEQNAAIQKTTGINTVTADNFKSYYRQILETALSTPDIMILQQKTLQFLNEFAARTDSASLVALQLASQQDKLRYAQEINEAVANPWFRYFIQFDPQPYLSKLKKVKVLALDGSRDIQVISQQNLPGLKNALIEGSTRTFDIKEMPGLNHLFQTCNKCTVAEYGELQETIAPVVLQTITDWLNKNVK